MVRVLICDDQVIVCEGLRAILGTSPEVEVVGVANNGAEALELVPAAHPDLILMDLKMPVMNGIQATRLVRERYPHIFVLVLTTYDADEWVFDAIRSGASGYLLKDTPHKELIQAILGTVSGKTHVDPLVAGKLFSQVAQSSPQPDTGVIGHLSDRELDVLRLLARGYNNATIAQQLFLSEGTIRNYVSTIFTKLGVADRTQAAVLAIRAGVVDLREIRTRVCFPKTVGPFRWPATSGVRRAGTGSARCPAEHGRQSPPRWILSSASTTQRGTPPTP